MRPISTAEMKKTDAWAIKDLGIPQAVLMENAGLRVVEAIKENYGIPESTIVICGKGNNGGDAAVVARHLFNAGCDVSVFLIGSKNELKGGAKVNFEIIRNMEINIAEITNKAQLKVLEDELPDTEIVIDGLFGIGLSSEVKGIYAEVIKLINAKKKKCKVVSVDIPSGLDSDSGKVRGVCIEADMTVTFHQPKTGLLRGQGPKRTGKIIVGDISIPISNPKNQTPNPKQIQSTKFKIQNKENLTDSDFVKDKLPKRKIDSNKGDNGKVLIIAGSQNMAGAAILTAKSALRAGSGLVYLSIPKTIQGSINKAVPEIITYFDLTVPEIKKMKLDAIAIGPGIGLKRKEFVKKLIRANLPVPMVLDADALNSISDDPEILLSRVYPTVITPHPGEMARLLKSNPAKVQSDRSGTAKKAAKLTNSIVVLKGAGTVISDQRGKYYINPTGNPGMASGGTGDVLTGIIISLIGQGMEALDAAVSGAFIHGLAGDISSAKKKQGNIIASDIIEALPEAFNAV